MSLLMDALRRAEEAKRLANPPDTPAAATAELSLAPLEAPPSPRDNSLPPLSRHFNSVDADLASEAATSPPRRRTPIAEVKPADTTASDASERIAARNVFAAKQTPRSRTSLWLFLGLGGVATLAIGGYFWWQLQSIPAGSVVRPTASTQPASPALPPPRPASSAGPAPPAATAAPPALPAVAAAVVERPRSGAVPEVPAPASRPLPRREAAANQPGEVPGVFRTGSSRTRQDQMLSLAYEAWQADRLDDARRGYEQVLRSDPRNADALLGMAAIDARQGRVDRAQDLYQRVLESDPTDATAQAALINLRGQSDAGQSESRLKTLLASQPESSALHFALGNLYARQGRWGEAQQAYFQSYALDPDNPDYLFNVAVSLDHLRQNKLAAQYYRMALNAADTRRIAFDRNVVGKRILELQP